MLCPTADEAYGALLAEPGRGGNGLARGTSILEEVERAMGIEPKRMALQSL
ncbi:MAG: hypothetical protein QOK23_2569 [Gammaproteobacteria bacterium]|jgi:hypothetical protein|nr:hypothetical protein [Gammaproteobacteria bacterium]